MDGASLTHRKAEERGLAPVTPPSAFGYFLSMTLALDKTRTTLEMGALLNEPLRGEGAKACPTQGPAVARNQLAQTGRAMSLALARQSMAEIQKLAHAPVIEAIFVFQADASAKWDAGAVREALRDLFPDYPDVQAQGYLEQTVEVVDYKEPTAKSEMKVMPASAFILNRPDKSAAIQVRREGFSYSKLEPYEDWDAFCESALGNWDKYASYFELAGIFTAYVRFINKLKTGLESLELKKYFQPDPRPPSKVDWNFIGFDERHKYLTPDSNFVIESRLSQSPGTEVIEFVLDNTVRPCKSPLTKEELVAVLPRLRDLKNQAFFSKLEDAALNPYL